MSGDEKQHYYVFSFSGKTEEGWQAEACSYLGLPTQNINRSVIVTARVYSGLKTGTLIAVSYLGYMSSNEFNTGMRDEI